MFSFQGTKKTLTLTAQEPSEAGFDRRGDATERMSFGVYTEAKNVKFASTKLVLIAMRVHLFPSRTQKLSSFAPTIVAGRLAVKIGNANISLPEKEGFFH